MLYPPSPAELTAYNELKYKKGIFDIVVTSTVINSFSSLAENPDNTTLYDNSINSLYNKGRKIGTVDTSTWEELYYDDYDIFSKLPINKKIKVKSKIKNISRNYSPIIIID